MFTVVDLMVPCTDWWF